MMKCEHKEWIGYPLGVIPTYWECIECGMKLTIGEMMIYQELNKLKELVNELQAGRHSDNH